ncbi:MAG: GGDEF domain-containing protein [Eubacteriales bacterium]|nr:GGDEF domain-containing protein [Eubacteriales bacterium]
MKIWKLQQKIVIFVILVTAIVPSIPVKAQSFLTKEEQEYIDSKKVIKAASIDGVAPLQYYDANGQAKGISINVLDFISQSTGLAITYQLYKNTDEAKASGADILFGVSSKTQSKDIPLSIPYLVTESILYTNSSVNPNELSNKRYAAIKGTNRPEGIKETSTIYIDTLENCLDAVDKGKADYGYGNAYSIAYYTLQNNYRNIITVPEKKDSREYCIGFLSNDEMLISIINKAILSIDQSHMMVLTLDAATDIERKITIPMVMDAYSYQIFAVLFIAIAILLFSIIRNVRSKNEIKLQYERYQMLSQTSNEYLYEYHIKTKHLELSQNCIELFGSVHNLKKLTAEFNKALLNHETTIPIIELPIADGTKSLFKSVNSFIYDDKGKVYSIIGKLIDINEEVSEKRKLIQKSEIDGLTGIYNAITTRNLITERIKSVKPNTLDALIVMDCDKYKAINDSYGHLQGDNVLINIGKALTKTFRETDIIGRIGGDEFCVYMMNIPSSSFAVSKCQQLQTLIAELNSGINVTVSIGISLLRDTKSYEELFQKADEALYDAKEKGGNQIQFFQVEKK